MSAQPNPGPATTPESVAIPVRLRSRHLLSIADLTPNEIMLILETAQAMKGDRHAPDQEGSDVAWQDRRQPVLRAQHPDPARPSRSPRSVSVADALNVAASTSSLVKGETLADTAAISRRWHPT